MRRGSGFASFPSVPGAPPQAWQPQGGAAHAARREEGGPTLGATEGAARGDEGDGGGGDNGGGGGGGGDDNGGGGGGGGGDELDESEMPAEFSIGVGGSDARPPSPAPSGKLAGFPAPPPFAGRARAGDGACGEGDERSEMPVEFLPSSAAPPTPPTEMPIEFFACAAAAGSGRLGTSSAAAPATGRNARALQALPVNQVQAGGAVERAAPAKGHVRPLRAALNSIRGRAPPSDGAIDADSARPVELAE